MEQSWGCLPGLGWAALACLDPHMQDQSWRRGKQLARPPSQARRLVGEAHGPSRGPGSGLGTLRPLGGAFIFWGDG